MRRKKFDLASIQKNVKDHEALIQEKESQIASMAAHLANLNQDDPYLKLEEIWLEDFSKQDYQSEPCSISKIKVGVDHFAVLFRQSEDGVRELINTIKNEAVDQMVNFVPSSADQLASLSVSLRKFGFIHNVVKTVNYEHELDALLALVTDHTSDGSYKNDVANGFDFDLILREKENSFMSYKVRLKKVCHEKEVKQLSEKTLENAQKELHQLESKLAEIQTPLKEREQRKSYKKLNSKWNALLCKHNLKSHEYRDDLYLEIHEGLYFALKYPARDLSQFERRFKEFDNWISGKNDQDINTIIKSVNICLTKYYEIYIANNKKINQAEQALASAKEAINAPPGLVTTLFGVSDHHAKEYKFRGAAHKLELLIGQTKAEQNTLLQAMLTQIEPYGISRYTQFYSGSFNISVDFGFKSLVNKNIEKHLKAR